MPRNRSILLAAVALAATAAVGCGGSGLESVQGKVLLGDEPLTTGSVTFHPVDKGPVATASIQSDGSFKAVTGSQAGVPPGKYRVTVIANGPAPPATKQNPEPLPPLITPPKYANPKTSPLECSVPLKEPLVLKIQP